MHLLLLAIAHVAMQSYAIKVPNGKADPDSGALDRRTPSRTANVKGKLFYDLTQ